MAANAQKMPANYYTTTWKQVDALRNKDLTKALVLVDELYARAGKDGLTAEQIKAFIYKQSLQAYADGAIQKDITGLEKQVVQSRDAVEKAIYTSLLASRYWDYYENHRWEIGDRTAITGDSSTDYTSWDARRFSEKVTGLFLASVKEKAALQGAKTGQYAAILTREIHTAGLRPTMYDVLMTRVIDFFNTSDPGVVDPVEPFVINDNHVFDPAASFAKHSFASTDSSDYKWLLLQSLQEWLSFRLQDNNTPALLDADLLRLQYVYNHSVAQDKQEAYMKALKALYDQNPKQPAGAMALYRYAELLAGSQQGIYSYKRGGSRVATDGKPAEAVALLHIILAGFKNTEAYANASNLKNELERPSIQVQAEKVVPINQPFLASLQYKNVTTAYVRVVKATRAELEDWQRTNKSWTAMLRNKAAVKSWSINCPATADLKQHRLEFKTEGLPAGEYVLLIGGNETLDEKQQPLAYISFNVSDLSAVRITGDGKGLEGYVLDRNNGKPIADASVKVSAFKWNATTRRQEESGVQQLVTDATGRFATQNPPSENGEIKLVVQKGTDKLDVNDRQYMGYYGEETDKPQNRAFVFTDRSIYRPGQTVHFKAMLLKQEQKGRSARTQQDQQLEVIFKDVNGQKIATQQLRTNAFGSVAGSFVIPTGLATGGYSINTEYGSGYISVEEYKRPKFEVTYEPQTATYKLGNEVKVTGKAMAYAGPALQDAKVSYRVTRNTRWPFFWCFWRWGRPSSPTQEIANGTLQTGADGSFTIPFTLKPDVTVDARTQPVFDYTVTAMVTDMNGETHEQNTTISAGYAAMVLDAAIGDKADAAQAQPIMVTAKNLAGNDVSANVTVAIAALNSPAHPIKKRYWDAPDQFVLDEAAFRKDFPYDEYKEEAEPLSWSKGATVYSKNLALNQKPAEDAMLAGLKPGWYMLELTARDTFGAEVKQQKAFYIYNSKTGEVPATEAISILTPGGALEPGAKADVTIAGADQPYVVTIIQKPEQRTVQLFTPQNNAQTVKLDITEADRGNIPVQGLRVLHNRVYTDQQTVNVPWSNKDLNVTIGTYRNKVLPGAKETWQVTISGSKKEKVAAELMAAMYDASLDQLQPHNWSSLQIFPVNYTRSSFEYGQYFSAGMGYGVLNKNWKSSNWNTAYPELITNMRVFDLLLNEENGVVTIEGEANALDGGIVEPSRARPAYAAGAPMMKAEAAAMRDIEMVTGEDGPVSNRPKSQQTPIRTNLQETAFFYPQLQTDKDGNISFSFTMPEALTRWRFMAMAHTSDLKSGYTETSIVTQKELMLTPNMPRFLRQGDAMQLQVKVANMSSKKLSGKASLQFINPETGADVSRLFAVKGNNTSFDLAQEASGVVSWNVQVPEDYTEPVLYRVVAKAGNFSDGEEAMLPVLTNRMLVTESLPFSIRPGQAKSLQWDRLLNSGSSSTLKHRSVNIEISANPAWYAVLALPYMMEYPYECAEQTFNRYYANAVAAHVVNSRPMIKKMMEQWQKGDSTTLMSNLSKNQELKNILLEETPWVLESNNESEQRRRIALLFNMASLAEGQSKTLAKLADMQLPSGAFGWFKGMYEDRYMTQYILSGIGRLRQLGVADLKNAQLNDIVTKALAYCDQQIGEDYNRVVKNQKKPALGSIEVQYLYMRSFFKDYAVAQRYKNTPESYLQLAKQQWEGQSNYMKGMLALALHRSGDKASSGAILKWLKDRVNQNEETGAWWTQQNRGWWWYEAPVEIHALLMEAFHEAGQDNALVNELKIWLLQQKRTQNWTTTKATADACYALLLTGDNWLESSNSIDVTMGKTQPLHFVADAANPIGYYKRQFGPAAIEPGMGKMEVSMKGSNQSVAWGAVYWQYFEQLDKITAAQSPLQIEKELYRETFNATGKHLEPITTANPLKIGDKVTVRVTIKASQDMDYVHLRDMRAACLEPQNVLSTYRYQGGLGYYESTRDAATHFFMDHLPKGTHVIEYPVFVTQKGQFSNGISTLQCMYAPEFSAHSAGVIIDVK